MLLFAADDYRRTTASWLESVNADEDYAKLLAREFHEKAPQLGLEPEMLGFPDGAKPVYSLWFFLPNAESVTTVLAQVYPDEVNFSFSLDGTVYEEDKYPHGHSEAVFGLWNAMSEALFKGAREEILGDEGI